MRNLSTTVAFLVLTFTLIQYNLSTTVTYIHTYVYLISRFKISNYTADVDQGHKIVGFLEHLGKVALFSISLLIKFKFLLHYVI